MIDRQVSRPAVMTLSWINFMHRRVTSGYCHYESSRGTIQGNVDSPHCLLKATLIVLNIVVYILMLSVYLYHKMKDCFKVHHEGRPAEISPASTPSCSGILLCCDITNRCFTACSVGKACQTLYATELKQEKLVPVQGNV